MEHDAKNWRRQRQQWPTEVAYMITITTPRAAYRIEHCDSSTDPLGKGSPPHGGEPSFRIFPFFGFTRRHQYLRTSEASDLHSLSLWFRRGAAAVLPTVVDLLVLRPRRPPPGHPARLFAAVDSFVVFVPSVVLLSSSSSCNFAVFKLLVQTALQKTYIFGFVHKLKVILSLREGRFQLKATQRELQETKAEVKRMQKTHPTRKGSLLFENDGEKRLSLRNSPKFSKVAVSARGMLLAQSSSTSVFDKLEKAIFMRFVRFTVALNSGEQSLEDKQSEGEFVDIYHDSDNASSVSELKTTGPGADYTLPSSDVVERNDQGLQLNLGHFACSIKWDFGWGISGNAHLFDMNFGTFEFNDMVKTIFDWAGSFALPVELLTRILKSGLSGIGSAVNFVLTTMADAGVTKASADVNAVCGPIEDHTPNGNGEVALLSTQTRNDDHGSPTATTSAGVDGELDCFTLELSFNVPSLPLVVVSIPLEFMPPTITTKLQICSSFSMGLGSDLAKHVLEIAGMGMPLIEMTQPIGSGMHFLPDGCIPFKNQAALTGVAYASRRAAYSNQTFAVGQQKYSSEHAEREGQELRLQGRTKNHDTS